MGRRPEPHQQDHRGSLLGEIPPLLDPERPHVHTTTFFNVRITITAESPKAAYDHLSWLLVDATVVDWASDTYQVDNGPIRDVAQLFD